MSTTPRLLLINGPPGIGKSTLARRYLDDHPLALLIEVDRLRTSLGRWQQQESSRLVARQLALALAETHLRSERDVVVPQFLGRIEFVLALERVARQTSARFVEVLLEVDQATAVDRFEGRRADLVGRGEAHPEGDVAGSRITTTIAAALSDLDLVAGERSGLIKVQAAGTPESTYAALMAEIDPSGQRA